jgi:dTDP-4-amino-4,6-dideoxygalactose transaminase
MKEIYEFEKLVAEYFNAPFAVATDSCTHALELCLRYTNPKKVTCPSQTYVSVPMTFMKLGLNWDFFPIAWKNYYWLGNTQIIDAAVYWKKDGYIENSLMCLSFQYKKHLSLGRGGMILTDNKDIATQLKKMSYDGRLPDIPWAEQNIDMLGYHYYMTPETATLGMQKFQNAVMNKPRVWSNKDYPDVSTMRVFNDKSEQ